MTADLRAKGREGTRSSHPNVTRSATAEGRLGSLGQRPAHLKLCSRWGDPRSAGEGGEPADANDADRGRVPTALGSRRAPASAASPPHHLSWVRCLARAAPRATATALPAPSRRSTRSRTTRTATARCRTRGRRSHRLLLVAKSAATMVAAPQASQMVTQIAMFSCMGSVLSCAATAGWCAGGYAGRPVSPRRPP